MKAARRTVGRCKAIHSLRQRLFGLTEQVTFPSEVVRKFQDVDFIPFGASCVFKKNATPNV